MGAFRLLKFNVLISAIESFMEYLWSSDRQAFLYSGYFVQIEW